MTRGNLWSVLGGLLIVSSTFTSAKAIEFEVDSSFTWLGYMNVFELPENGGGYVYGEPWGLPALTSEFSSGTLKLGATSVDDAGPFWYTTSGPGGTGNKNMDANLYVQDDTLVGQEVTFSGNVLSNSLVSPYVTTAFIRDFAPDYSSYETSFVDLQPGPFSVTLQTINSPGRHVQFGFNTNGPIVWVTDIPAQGSVVIETVGPSGVTGDYNGDNTVDAADYTVWRDNLGTTNVLPNDPAGGTITTTQYDNWKANFGQTAPGGAAVASVVPEPASCLLLLMSVGALVSRRSRR
jgi:hypothetical protein